MSKEPIETEIPLPTFLLQETDVFAEPPYSRIKAQMLAMSAAAPQVLLIEGGSRNERLAVSLLWACLLNCEHNGGGLPCLACSTCNRFIHAVHRDFFILDGREESIKLDAVREWVRPVLGEPPREAGKRVILLAEAQALGIEAANALLKSLEEPKPQNAFIMTVPQRERLLPTLVSRSWTLTLPWPEPGKRLGAWEERAARRQTAVSASEGGQSDCLEWEIALADYLKSGRGWFGKTGAKGAVTATGAQELLALVQSALAAVLLDGKHAAAGGELYKVLSGNIDYIIARRVYEAVAVCQTALQYKVNPALVIDWLAVRLFVWLEELRRQRHQQGG